MKEDNNNHLLLSYTMFTCKSCGKQIKARKWYSAVKELLTSGWTIADDVYCSECSSKLTGEDKDNQIRKSKYKFKFIRQLKFIGATCLGAFIVFLLLPYEWFLMTSFILVWILILFTALNYIND